MSKWILLAPLAFAPCLVRADIKITAQAGANTALLTWKGDSNATYLIIGRERGTTQEVRRSIYPFKGLSFLDASLESKAFQYKVQRIDASGKVLEQSGWTTVKPTEGRSIAWAIYPPGDPSEPFKAGAVADGGSGSGKMYVDGAFYGNTVSSKHPTNSQLHYVSITVEVKGLAKGEHSLVITVPDPKGSGFLATQKMYIKIF